jgi:hypothetical protein
MIACVGGRAGERLAVLIQPLRVLLIVRWFRDAATDRVGRILAHARPGPTQPTALVLGNRRVATLSWDGGKATAGPALVTEWAGHTVGVLMRVYAKCAARQQDEAKRRILEAAAVALTTQGCLAPR